MGKVDFRLMILDFRFGDEGKDEGERMMDDRMMKEGIQNRIVFQNCEKKLREAPG